MTETGQDMKPLRRMRLSTSPAKRIAELKLLVAQIDGRLSREEELVGILRGQIECIMERLSSVDKKLEGLIQAQVMDCAEEREAYVRFVNGFLALLDLVDEKLKLHRAGTERPEMLGFILNVVNGSLPISGWYEYLDDVGGNPDIPKAFNDKWMEGVKEICEKTRELLPSASSMKEMDRMSEKFNGGRFCDLLIVPSVGESYNGDTMYARTVEPDDDSPYAVDEVMKFGMRKSCGLDETRKAVVKVI